MTPRLLSLVLATLLPATPAAGAAGEPPPNVVLFVVDDLGWMDSGAYGSQYYETPNIDRLAAEGMLFRNAYAASPLCSPSRASILTGRYPGRLQLTRPIPPQAAARMQGRSRERAPPFRRVIEPTSRNELPLQEVTLAEALAPRGYVSALIGKWHLGDTPHSPENQGFAVNIAGSNRAGAPSWFSPYGIATLTDGPRGEYLTDRLTQEALRFIRQNRARPFLVVVSHFAVHAPWQAKEDLVRRYRSKVDPRGEQSNPVIAAIIQSVDESLGQILNELDEQGLRDRTIVVVTSDNGQLERLPDRVPPRFPFPPGALVTSNAPLRGGKGTLWEGGTRAPLIFRWPGSVAPNSTSDAIASGVDLFPTLLDAAGVEIDAGRTIDGVSLLPVLRGLGNPGPRAIFCHFPHETREPAATYVRSGNWKLIRFWHANAGGSHRHELYELASDIGESNDLAARMPDRVAELSALIDAHLRETGSLLPRPNPAYDPSARPGAQPQSRERRRR